jgi:hypothetical protein
MAREIVTELAREEWAKALAQDSARKLARRPA